MLEYVSPRAAPGGDTFRTLLSNLNPDRQTMGWQGVEGRRVAGSCGAANRWERAPGGAA